MDKKNLYARQGSNKILVSESRKSDNLHCKPWTKNKKRDSSCNNTNNNNNNINNTFKTDQRASKQHNNSNKFRSNVDKRPKSRNCIKNNGNTNTLAESLSSSGLVEDENEATREDGENKLSLERNIVELKELKELNSIYASGSKKQNLNHLLNFNYTPYDNSHGSSLNIFGKSMNNNIKSHRRAKYNKEQYLQANFQFVIKTIASAFIDISNPDAVVEWDFIEQINIQTSEEPQCPICLYPPIAAKLTRCGHVYCWPCILHYLDLSDKTWRKCPICYEAIHIKDLKSTSIMQQVYFKVNDTITFQLMRRKKGSIFAEKFSENEEQILRGTIPEMKDEFAVQNIFSKFLVADPVDVFLILEREYNELLNENEQDCPESIFVQKALNLLEERKQQTAKESKLTIEQLNELLIKIKMEKSQPKDKQAIVCDETLLSLSSLKINEEVKEIKKDFPKEHFPFLEVKDDVKDAKKCQILKESVPTKPTEEDQGAIKKEKFYYFYQSNDGQNIFLHPLNVKMLQSMYGTLNKGPKSIKTKIIQKEFYSMDEDIRRKFTCLGHLPLTCQFEIVEVDFQPPIVSNYVLKMFKDDILARQKARHQRDREEKRREKTINEFNDRQMGKFISRSMNLDIASNQQFPSCGFEKSLPSNSYEESSLRAYDVDLASSPPVPFQSSNQQNRPTTSFANIVSSPKKELWPTLGNGTSDQNSVNFWNNSTINFSKSPLNNSSKTPREVTSAELETGSLNSIRNSNLGDVLAEAFEIKKKQVKATKLPENSNNGSKKIKKNKKSVLFTTGMNFTEN